VGLFSTFKAAGSWSNLISFHFSFLGTLAVATDGFAIVGPAASAEAEAPAPAASAVEAEADEGAGATEADAGAIEAEADAGAIEADAGAGATDATAAGAEAVESSIARLSVCAARNSLKNEKEFFAQEQQQKKRKFIEKYCFVVALVWVSVWLLVWLYSLNPRV